MSLYLSLIVPVYNRPQEVEELLGSLLLQSNKDFEVVIVEDGSSLPCAEVVDRYADKLRISYYTKPNSGPGQSRNYGAARAKGNYFIFLDSDCVIPEDYTKAVYLSLEQQYVDAFGGPDAAHENFTDFQKAINYSMTSVITTGGIRGGGEKMDKFFPRSFNMGYSKAVFEQTGGFGKVRFGEDIDMSIRILSNGFTTRLIREAFVYHKRRSTFRQFFKQVHNSGIARINLNKRHPGTLKLVHALPAVFTLGVVFLMIAAIFCWWFILPLLFFFLVIFADASLRNKSLKIGWLSMWVSFVQLTGYGSGFIIAFIRRHILGQDEFASFEKTFYK
ncbi:MAG: glycosyltransferase [Sphingobacteriales bacterium]|nr:MAG: glycosyltransferase [Sphingobacteriales bacterium]